MRLTKTDKSAFVKAVINDVPWVDYHAKATKLVREYFEGLMPPSVQVAYKNNPDWFSTDVVYTPIGLSNVYVTRPVTVGGECLKKTPVWDELVELGKQAEEQIEKLEELRASVKGAIEGCSTLEGAKKKLPELEKYLPTDRSGFGTANLPVVNVVTKLMAAGWPKGA